MQKQWDDKSKQLMEDQAISKIIEMHENFELPETLINSAKAEITKSMKAQNPDINLDEEANQKYIDIYAEKMVRTELVRNQIIEKEDLKVEDFDFENFIDSYYSAHPEMADTLSRDVLLTHIKGDEQMAHRLLMQKFVDFILDFTKTNEIDFEEFQKMNLEKSEIQASETNENE
jgi:FKBP-type peptidyl-prolyl cis-trans isomerase (trigger factor)